MSRESRMFAGILLVVIPSVMYGGLTLLMLLTGDVPGYRDNPLRHDLWRAGHAHAGVYLVLSLVMLIGGTVISCLWLKIEGTFQIPIAAAVLAALGAAVLFLELQDERSA